MRTNISIHFGGLERVNGNFSVRTMNFENTPSFARIRANEKVDEA